MTRKEASACYTTLLSMANGNFKFKLKKFLDAFIKGDNLQLQADDMSWVDYDSPNFTPESLKRMRIKPGPTPYGVSAIHKLNGKTVRNKITGDVRFVFIDAQHKATLYKKDQGVTAETLMREYEDSETGSLLGVPPSDRAPEIKSTVKMKTQPFPEVVATVTTNTAGIKAGPSKPAIPASSIGSIGSVGSSQFPALLSARR